MGIITTLAGLLPDWVTSVIIAALLWYGANYLFLTKYHFDGVFKEYNKNDNENKCSEIDYEDGFQDQRTNMALYTFSFGMIENESSLFRKACSI